MVRCYWLNFRAEVTMALILMEGGPPCWVYRKPCTPACSISTVC
jgi:hypothetical protein